MTCRYISRIPPPKIPTGGVRVQLMAGDKGLAKRTLQLVLPFVSLGASLVLGTVAGVAMASCLLWRGPSLQPFARLARRLGPSSGARCRVFSFFLAGPQGPVFPGNCHGAYIHLHIQQNVQQPARHQ